MIKVKSTVKDLIGLLEQWYNCEAGPPKASWEVGPADNPVRYVYVVYAIAAPTESEAVDWLWYKVFRPMALEAEISGRLYWRNEAKIEARENEETGRWYIRTRIVITDKDGKTVQSPEHITLEGAMPLQI